MRGAVARAIAGGRSRGLREQRDRTAAPDVDGALPLSRLLARPELVAAAGIDFCRERRLLPLWPASDGRSAPLLVAAADPADRATIRELRRRLARPIEVVPASGTEIAVALDESLGLPAGASRRRLLAGLLVELGLLAGAEGDAYVEQEQDEPHLGASLVEGRLIGEEERREAVALAFALPRIDLARRPPRPDLDAVLPASTLRELRLLPLWRVGGELFLAVVDPPNAAALARVAEECGLVPRPLLADPGALTALIEQAATIADQERVAAGGSDRDALLRAGVARGQIDAADALARELAIPLGEALERVAGVDAAAVRRARARAAGIAALDGDIGSTPVEARAALPPTLARSLRAVVVGHDGAEALVAMADPWNARARRALGALLGQHLRPLLASEPAVEALLTRLPEHRPAVAARESTGGLFGLLREAGFIRPPPPADIDPPPEEPAARDVEALWARLPIDARVEALALAYGLPTVERLLWRAQAASDETTTPAPMPTPDEEAALPLATLDALRLVAVAAEEGAPPDALPWPRKAASLGQRDARGAVRLALASPRDVRAARGAIAGSSAPSSAHEALGRLLERRYGVEHAALLTLWRRIAERGEALDVAARGLRLIAAPELRDALAHLSGVEPLTLARTEANDARLGRGPLRDPVDHAIARLLPLEEARRLGALPVRRVETDGEARLLVAIVDPLDEVRATELRCRLGGIAAATVELRPATRTDVQEAALRVHGRPVLGDMLLDDDLLSRADLSRALALAERTGVRLGDALESLRLLSEEQIAERVAKQRGLPFYTLRGLDLDREVAALLPLETALAAGALPIAHDESGCVTLALADAADDAARERATAALLAVPAAGRENAPTVTAVEPVATTRSDLRDALERLYHDQFLERSAEALATRSPEESAHRVLSTGQKRFFIVALLVLGASLALWTMPTLITLLAAATGFYLAFSSYKFYLIYRAFSHTLEVPVTAEELAGLDERDLPVYTVLVPLYREAALIPDLVRGLSRLDYPLEKLDVKLLLEEDDAETIAAARSLALPAFVDVTIVPDGHPKGKPKACNYGLIHARGEFVVIFDAEDIPEPDQLRKVLIAFARSPASVVCIQAKLNYYNRNQNALTKWFTTEYSTWFDLFLPGLDASGAPIPLGGTSNHFRIGALRAAGAWDPYNVTEDADLGLRIFKLGGRTAVVDSTTFEEANSVLDNWVRQRSRWVKGYIQTYLVHMRHPFQLWQQLGTGGFLSFQLVIGGTAFSFLLNPVLWGLTVVWFATRWEPIQDLFPGPVYYIGALSLYGGNFAFAYMNVAGSLRRRYYSLVLWALLSPLYWVLMSVAAWKGLLQLFYRPFYWEKTVHGLSTVAGLEAADAIGSERVPPAGAP